MPKIPINKDLFEFLTEKQKFVLIGRFGLGGAKKLKLHELAKKLKVTRERIRQIEFAALRKLRQTKLQKWQI